MNLGRLALRRIAGSPFRSGLIFLCITLVAGSSVWATLIIQGAEENLIHSISGMQNLGVDFLVVPRVRSFSSTGTANVDLVELMSAIKAVPGVESVSPQVLLSLPSESEYESKPEIRLVAFDPATDFSVLPWLQEQPASGIGVGDAVAGSQVSSPNGGNELNLAGYKLRLVGHLSPTASSMDQTLYVTFETSQELARQVQTRSNANPGTTANNVPYILVKVESGTDSHVVTSLILRNIRGISVFDRANFFSSANDQITSLLKKIPWLLGIGWGLTVVWIDLIFSIAVNERRREIGILRALGSTRFFVFRSLLAEGILLAMCGVIAGIILSVLAVGLTRESLLQSTGVLLASFSPVGLLLLTLESLGLTLSSVFLAAIFPSLRISHQDPAAIMRG